jgi:hypothetical protein
MKKKYDLPIGGSNKGTPEGKAGKVPTSGKKASDAAGPKEPAIPKTPSKTGRVTKPRATSSTKKKATPKTKAKVESDEEMKADKSDEDIDSDSKEAYEDIFGNAEEDDDNEDEDAGEKEA